MEETEYKSNEELNWNKLYKVGGVAAIVIVLIIPIQLVIFTLFPPPETTMGFFELFRKNWLIGLLSLDLLYYINNGILILVYLGLFAALRKVNFTNMLIATIIGLTGIAVYYVSAVGFEVLSISKQYFSAESMEYKQQLLAVGQGLIARYKGTAFDVYYVFNAITLILISMTMYKSRDFKRSSATWGLIAGIFMIIPSTAGTLGLICSLLSLVPWIVFSVLIGRKLIQMAKQQV
ncbi:DUF4386 family protein [Petrimonas sulfuriphila]|uniref:DUF4386 family protein n=1 Tax=Petrimonas sulfuriphila TaxID=285070 RepID=UPI003EB839E5